MTAFSLSVVDLIPQIGDALSPARATTVEKSRFSGGDENIILGDVRKLPIPNRIGKSIKKPRFLKSQGV
jgi:hypothetical protein